MMDKLFLIYSKSKVQNVFICKLASQLLRRLSRYLVKCVISHRISLIGQVTIDRFNFSKISKNSRKSPIIIGMFFFLFRQCSIKLQKMHSRGIDFPQKRTSNGGRKRRIRVQRHFKTSFFLIYQINPSSSEPCTQ